MLHARAAPRARSSGAGAWAVVDRDGSVDRPRGRTSGRHVARLVQDHDDAGQRVLGEHGGTFARSTHYAVLGRPATSRMPRDEPVPAGIRPIRARSGRGAYGAHEVWRPARPDVAGEAL